MRAISFSEHGDLSVLRYGDLPDPTPINTSWVTVRVARVALNHLDIWVRRGWPGLTLSMPHITGSDIVGYDQDGTLVGVYPGFLEGSDEWTTRGEPSVSPRYQVLGEHLPGGLAEQVAVPRSSLFPLPEGCDLTQECARILVSLTCWRMLVRQAKIQSGESVLVVGSGGGINSLSIAMAAAMGAHVIALAGNDEKCLRAKDLGAAHVIDYERDPQWHKEVLRYTDGRGVDLVVDNVGQATFPLSLKAVRWGGRVVTVGNTSGHAVSLDNRLIFGKQITLIGSTMGSMEDLMEARTFLNDKKISVPIDTVAPLSDGIAMIERIEQGSHFGKIVLTPL